MRRRDESAIESLFSMPWWLTGLLSVGVFFSPNILKLAIPIREGPSGAMLNSAFVTAAETLAPLLVVSSIAIQILQTYVHHAP